MRSLTYLLRRLAVIGLVDIIMAMSSSAQPPSQNFEFLSETLQTSAFYKVAVEGDRLYAATGYGLEVFDISDLQQPRSLGRAATYGFARSLAVRDSIVYLMDTDRGSYVFDASNPANIALLSQRMVDTYFDGQRIFGDKLYECVWREGIRISDISDPREPVFRGTYRRGPLPTAIWIQDTVAYIADVGNEVIITANLTNPARSEYYGSVDVPRAQVDDLYAQDTLLFAAAGEVGVMIYGLSNPTAPNLLTTIASNDWAANVYATGNALYVADGGGGLRVFDISDPTNPEEIFTSDYTVYYAWPFAQGIIASSVYSLGFFSIADPRQPELIASIGGGSTVTRMDVYQKTVYVPSGKSFKMLDIDDPTNPQPIEWNDTLACYRVAATGDGWLYTSGREYVDSTNYLRAWDISDPHSPQLRGSATVTTAYGEFSISEDLLAYTNYLGSTELWDISSRGAPSYLTQISGYPCIDAHVDGSNLYLFTDDDWLRMFDVSEPENPVNLGGVAGLEYPNDITSIGQKVYVTEGGNGVTVFDISDPRNIVRVGSAHVTDWAINIEYADSLLYVGDLYNGVRAYNPFSADIPRLAGYIETPGYGYRCKIDDGICIIADWFDLTIARYVRPDEVSEREQPPRAFNLLRSFPNPANSSFKTIVTLPSAATGSLKLYSSDGKLVADQSFQTQGGKRLLEFDASALPSGNYNLMLDARAPQEGRKYHQIEQITVVK